MPARERPSAGSAIWRGVRQRCPACGSGDLFAAYLKPVGRCGTCGEDLSHIRAEDGPSWLTILMLGPILVPIVFLLTMSGMPIYLLAPITGVGIFGAVLALLPRVKGGFVGVLWALQIQTKSESE